MNNMIENTRNWRKTKRGLITNLFHKMKSRNTVMFDLAFLHSFAECKKFDRLYNEWVNSGYVKQLKPSIDRIRNKGVYSVDNIQWLTWAENRFKQRMERKHRSLPVNQLLNGIVVNTYKSQKDVIMKTGLSQSNLSMTLNGKRALCGGYKWEYIHQNPELL